MKKIAIVVLHYADKNLTSQFLESTKKLLIPNFQFNTIIVNNNPQEDLKDLKTKFPKFTFLDTSRNLGFAEGNNVGIKKALADKADYIFIVNNDTLLEKNLLVQLIKVAESDKKIGILGPKIYFAPGFEYHKNRYKAAERGKVFWYAGGLIDWENILASHRGVDEVDQGQYEKQIETDFVSGCAMFVKREVFEKIGLFDRHYFLYLEDNDFCQRAKKAGFKVIYTPKAKLWHFNASSSQVGGSLQDYFITRNRLLFGIEYAPFRAKLSLLKESLGLLLQGRDWQKMAIKDFYLRNFGEGSWKKGYHQC